MIAGGLGTKKLKGIELHVDHIASGNTDHEDAIISPINSFNTERSKETAKNDIQ